MTHPPKDSASPEPQDVERVTAKKPTRVTRVVPVDFLEPAALAARRRPSLGRLILYGVLALIVIAGGIFAAQTIAFYANHVATDDAQIEGHIAPVLPRVAGHVSDVLIHDNQHVVAGDVLVRIDARDFEARVTMAEAARANAQAAVSVAQAHVEAARSRNLKGAQDLTRAAALVAKHVVSQQEFDAAKSSADAAAADLEAAVRGVAAAQAQVAQQVGDLDYAQLQLTYTTITAPAAGTVSKKSVEVGQYVQVGQPLVAIVDDQGVWVVANFKETQLRRMRVGQPATIDVDAYPQLQFPAHVDSIAAATGAKFSLLPPDNATGNFVKVVQRVPVKIVFNDPPDANHPLRVGMDVTAIVTLP